MGLSFKNFAFVKTQKFFIFSRLMNNPFKHNDESVVIGPEHIAIRAVLKYPVR